MNNTGQTHEYRPRIGYGDRPIKKPKPTYWVKSGPNYVGKDGPHDTVEAALEAASRRPYWRFIVNQAWRVVVRNPEYKS